MTSPHWAKLAARVLASSPDDEPMAAPLADRARLISKVELALREKGRGKARARWAARLGVAAAVVLVAGVVGLAARNASAPVASLAPTSTPQSTARSPAAADAAQVAASAIVGHTMGGEVTVTSPGSTTSLTEGKPLVAGSRVDSRAGARALLAFGTGTQLTVDEESELTVVEQGPSQVFALAFGAVHADVAKLREGERFIVRTEDAEVEAAGTSFRVATATRDAACGDGALTRVAVYEGTVTVRHRGGEAQVRAGEAWPSRCARASDVAGAPTRRGHRGARSAAAAIAPSITTPAVVESESRLKEINDKFAVALAAKNGGAPTAAIVEFDKFLAAYPGSSLAENAAVERMKLLASVDRARGANAANAYLSRYPSGFARRTAEAIAAGRP